MLDWSDAPFAKWFVGGKLNVAYNCVDRHVEDGHGDQVAIPLGGRAQGDTRTITYAELKDEVCRAANALVELGVQTGDRIAIYMPMIPETVVAMLACARLGAPHTVVFGGFSATALSDRIIDCDARVVITADGGYRRGSPSAPEDRRWTRRCRSALTCATVLVVKRTGQDVDVGRRAGRVVARRRWRQAVRRARAARPSTPSTRCSSCTPPARPGSRRASCTRPAAI